MQHLRAMVRIPKPSEEEGTPAAPMTPIPSPTHLVVPARQEVVVPNLNPFPSAQRAVDGSFASV